MQGVRIRVLSHRLVWKNQMTKKFDDMFNCFDTIPARDGQTAWYGIAEFNVPDIIGHFEDNFMSQMAQPTV